MIFVLLLPLLLAPQHQELEPLLDRCGSQIRWISDPVVERERKTGRRPGIDRKEILEKAKARAREEGRLILWYVYGLDGRQMYRGDVVDLYTRIAFWTDPDVVDVVNRKFVPLRMHADLETGEALKIQSLDVVEPAIVILDPGGRVVHVLERIRTWNADWLRHVLLRVLSVNSAYGAPAETEDARELIRSGDYSEAVKLLSTKERRMQPETRYWMGVVASRLREARAAESAFETARLLKPPADLADDIEAAHALLKLRQRDLAGAAAMYDGAIRTHPKSDRLPEMLFYRAVIEWFQGKEPAAMARWEKLGLEHPGSPWAWRAAANVLPSRDLTPHGPTVHGFEDFFWGHPDIYRGLPTGTAFRRTRSDLEDIVERGVKWLLRHQRSDGSWNDTRYAFWPDPSITPNARMAATTLAMAALLEWRDLAPERVDKALRAGEDYIFNRRNFAWKTNEETYAHAYRLVYLSRKEPGDKAAAAAMAESVRVLEERQLDTGFWLHEYPNPFVTATVMIALFEAKRAGAEVSDEVLKRAAEGMARSRSDEGTFPYSIRTPPRKPSGLKDAAGRLPACELALWLEGRGSQKRVRKALDNYWEHYKRIEGVRKCDFHADGELGGFFFYHNTLHAVSAARKIDSGGPDLKRFIEELVRIPEIDGSFVDDHEIGKAYGTGMALISIRDALGER